MTGPLGGANKDLGVPTTYVGDIDDAPLEALMEPRERPPPISEKLMQPS
jgi:hypothetical protein